MTYTAQIPAEQPPVLPDHVEQTVQAIARLNAAHDSSATTLQRIVDRLTAFVARPAFLAGLTLTVVAWIGGNLAFARLAGRSPDPGPFFWLQGVVELTAIYITALVLMSQRRKDAISELREQLTLELAIISEQKVAKIVALLEETRRDNPLIADRVDPQAEAMSTPADAEAVVAAIKETKAEPQAAED